MRLHTKRIRHIIKKSFLWYAISILVVSGAGAFIAIRGHQRVLEHTPSGIYQDVTFQSHARDKQTLSGWFLPSNGQKVALIVHGWGGNRSTFLETAEYLQQSGISVLTIDLRGGSGRSSYGMNETGDVEGAINWLRNTKGYSNQDITIIANSMGGSAAMHYAASHSLDKLVLISSVIDLNHTRAYYARDLHLFFPSLYAYGVSVVERIVFGVQAPNIQGDFNNLNIPVFVIHGSDDQKAPLSDWEKAISRLSMQRKESVTFWVIPNGSHTVFEDDREVRSTGNQRIRDYILSSVLPEAALNS